ncbi:MAG: DUF1636 domain-containing protein [Rhodospirillales bacterium]
MPNRRQTIYVCNRCNYSQSEAERAGKRSGANLHDQIAQRFADWPHRARFNLAPVECMSNCKRPCIVVLSAPGKYTFMFGDLAPGAEAVTAVLECALTYESKQDGFMTRDERPKSLRKSILARIPAVKSD